MVQEPTEFVHRHLRLTALLVGCPEGQVVAQKLHDEGGILVRVLSHIVELGNCILKCRARHFASLFRVAKHLVLKHRKVQGETQADWMCHRETCGCDVGRIVVCLPGILCCSFLFVICLELR